MSKSEQDDAYKSARPESDEQKSGTPGAKGGSDSDSADKLPGIPSKDDAPLGSTDQHSDA